MKKLIRDKSTPENIAFWAAVKKSASAVKDWPDWMKAGININPANFETYEPKRNK